MNPTQGLLHATGVTDLHRAAQQGNISQARILLGHCFGLDVNVLDSKEQAPLFYACSEGNFEMVKLLMKSKAKIAIYDSEGRMPIMIAAQIGHKGIVEILGHVSLHADKLGRRIIHYACAGGNVEVLKYIISVRADTYDVNVKDLNGWTPLFYACSAGHLEMVLVLVSEFQADPTIQDNEGCRATMIAAQSGYKKIVEVLNYVSMHSDTDKLGRTIIHYACAGGNVEVLKYVISMKANAHALNLKDLNGWTPLFHACRAGHLEMVLALVSEFQADPTIQDNEGCTATMIAAQSGYKKIVEVLNNVFMHSDTDKLGRTIIHYACAGGNVEVLKYVISMKANAHAVNLKDLNGWTPLFHACRAGHLELVLVLISEFQADSTIQDNEGCTATMIAAQTGHKKIVEALNCDPLYADKFDRTLLHYACTRGDIELAEKCLTHGADVNAQDDQNNTPLHVAATVGKEDVVLMLINEFGCDLNIKGHLGRTPLHAACCGGHVSLARDLISNYMADINAQDDRGFTPLQVAVLHGQVAVAEIIIRARVKGTTLLHTACSVGNIEIVRDCLLRESKAIYSYDCDKNTPLHVAALWGQEEVVATIMNEFKSDVNAKGHLGRTPLHAACCEGHASLARKLILSYKADINAQDDQSNTPLHVAASFGQEKVVVMLATTIFCDLTVRGHIDRTVLHCACSSGNVSLVNTLLDDHNADINARDDHYYTPLQVAVAYGRKELAQTLLKRFEKASLLHFACSVANISIVKDCLLEDNAAVNSYDDEGNTPLHVAAMWGQEKVFSTLLLCRGCDLAIRGYNGRYLLHSACIGGNMNIVRAVAELQEFNVVDDDGNTPLHVATLNGKDEIVIALIKEFKCDPAVRGYQGRSLLHSACIGENADLVGKLCQYNISLLEVDCNGDTPLHTASSLGDSKCVEVLLSHGAPLLVRNSSGRTSLDVAIGETRVFFDTYLLKNRSQIYEEYDAVQEFAKKKYSRPERVIRIFVIGNPGAGKSSLIETLKRENRLDYLLRRVSESSVPPHTAGIIPSIHMSKYCGRILFYDFAGDPEYYSSHAAILESLTASKKGFNIFVIVIDLREEIASMRRIINYWTTFIQNQAFDEKNMTFIIVGSHLDALSSKERSQKSQDFRSTCDRIRLNDESKLSCFMLDCRRPQSNEVIRLQKEIISVTKNTPHYQLSLQASILLGLLEKDFGHVISCSIQSLLSHIENTGIGLPKENQSLFHVLSELQDIGLLLNISTTEISQLQIVLNVSQLTNEVHQQLFSKEALERLGSIDIDNCSSNPSFNIGIIPEELLFPDAATSHSTRIVPLPKFITKECLIQLQYCQEIHCEDVHTFLPLSVSTEQSYLFFPALCTAQKHEIALWNDPPEVKCSQGWLMQCTDPYHHFTPRFLHILLLRLIFKFTLQASASASSPDHSAFQRQCCRMWSTGVFWSMREGVKFIVELVRDSNAVAVLARSDNDSPKNFAKYFTDVITCVRKTRSDFCRHIKPEFFLLDSTKESDYFNLTHMYRMTDIEEVLQNPKDMAVIHNVAENKQMKVSRLQMLFAHSCRDFTSYVSSLPPAARPHLEYQLDWDNDVDRDLRQLAHHMQGWDVELSTHLCLTEVDISDIKEQYSMKPQLRRREALLRWKKKTELRQRATYGNLLQVFVDAGHTKCAEELCQLLRSKYEDIISSDSSTLPSCKPKIKE